MNVCAKQALEEWFRYMDLKETSNSDSSYSVNIMEQKDDQKMDLSDLQVDHEDVNVGIKSSFGTIPRPPMFDENNLTSDNLFEQLKYLEDRIACTENTIDANLQNSRDSGIETIGGWTDFAAYDDLEEMVDAIINLLCALNSDEEGSSLPSPPTQRRIWMVNR